MLIMGRSGFTLIELSVVLVIIGLVVGGVLVGRDLIKASEVRAQISQIEEFKTAVNTFREKYGYLPGDMPPNQAGQLGFFTFTGPAAGLGCPAEEAAYGNNDGAINILTEQLPFWSHLADSHLVKGNYAGTAGNLLLSSVPGCVSSAGSAITLPVTLADYEIYYPKSKISSNAVVSARANYRYAPSTSSVIYTGVKFSNIFIISEGTLVGGYGATANQLYQMDAKVDDGMPATGSVREGGAGDFGTGTPRENPPCTTSGVSPIKYDLSSATANTIVCTPAFLF